MLPLGPQGGALQHAEPVLLVDDHQPEPVKPDVPLHQRVRADHQVDRAAFDLGELLPPRRGGRRRRSAAPRGTARRCSSRAMFR